MKQNKGTKYILNKSLQKLSGFTYMYVSTQTVQNALHVNILSNTKETSSLSSDHSHDIAAHSKPALAWLNWGSDKELADCGWSDKIHVIIDDFHGARRV